MESTFCLSDDYDHIDTSIEYVLENVLSQETIERTDNYECIKLRELYNTLLVNTCSCEDNCSSCVHGGSYVLGGKANECVIRTINRSDLIYECSDQCRCKFEDCHNRVVQRGPRKHLKIVKSQKFMSNGIVTMADIPQGAFICEYAGELLTFSEAKRRMSENAKSNKMNYVLCLKEHRLKGCFESEADVAKVLTTIVDPAQKGNIGRYLNHSCEPNCQIFSVRIDSPIPKIGIFSKRFISAGEELCFHYNEGTSSHSEIHSGIGIPCLCGSKICKKFLPNVEM